MNKRTCFDIAISSIFLFMLLSGTAFSDVSSLVKECEDCHGQNGISEWPDIPTIAGMSEYTQSDALLLFKDRERPCESSKYRRGDTSREPTDMCAVTDKLTEEQIDELAAYYSTKPFVAAKQNFDAAKVEIGREIHAKKCEKCHVDGGTNPDEDAGILAGQWTDYLKQSFDDFLSGDRDQPKKMKEKLATLSPDDIDALLQYYASQQ